MITMISIMNPEEKFSQNVFDNFCFKHKLNFPKQFVQFLSQYNDGELERNIIEGYDDCCIRYFYGTTSFAYSNIEDVFECFKERMPHNCIAIAEAEGGNQICVSLEDNTHGKIYFWDHETMDVDEGEECEYSIDNMPLVANSFDELLKKIISC